MVVTRYSGEGREERFSELCQEVVRANHQIPALPPAGLPIASHYASGLRLAQQVRQLGDIRRNPLRLVGEQLRRRSPAGSFPNDPTLFWFDRRRRRLCESHRGHQYCTACHLSLTTGNSEAGHVQGIGV